MAHHQIVVRIDPLSAFAPRKHALSRSERRLSGVRRTTAGRVDDVANPRL